MNRLNIVWIVLGVLCFGIGFFFGLRGYWGPLVGMTLAAVVGFLLSKRDCDK